MDRMLFRAGLIDLPKGDGDLCELESKNYSNDSLEPFSIEFTYLLSPEIVPNSRFSMVVTL